jgi:hypothetical protein
METYMGPAPRAIRRNLENCPATLLVTKRRSSPELISRSISLWFQVLSTRIVWRPGETDNEIASPNMSSALRSPSSKTNICRVCTSSGESRVTVTLAEVAVRVEAFSGCMKFAVSNCRRKRAGAALAVLTRQCRADRECRGAARCATGARDRSSGGPVR